MGVRKERSGEGTGHGEERSGSGTEGGAAARFRGGVEVSGHGFKGERGMGVPPSSPETGAERIRLGSERS
jgi:hypothetical protein